MQIITNNVPRNLIHWCDLTPSEKEEFDWMNDWQKEEAGFIRYLGNVHYLFDFMNCQIEDWTWYHAYSAFTATLIKLHESGDKVIMGRAIIGNERTVFVPS